MLLQYVRGFLLCAAPVNVFDPRSQPSSLHCLNMVHYKCCTCFLKIIFFTGTVAQSTAAPSVPPSADSWLKIGKINILLGETLIQFLKSVSLVFCLVQSESCHNSVFLMTRKAGFGGKKT